MEPAAVEGPASRKALSGAGGGESPGRNRPAGHRGPDHPAEAPDALLDPFRREAGEIQAHAVVAAWIAAMEDGARAEGDALRLHGGAQQLGRVEARRQLGPDEHAARGVVPPDLGGKVV